MGAQSLMFLLRHLWNTARRRYRLRLRGVGCRHFVVLACLSCFLGVGGCSDDAQLVRQIQTRQQDQMQLRSVQDHLSETFELLNDFVELNPEKARQQITYHMNKWRLEAGAKSADAPETTSEVDDAVSQLLRTISEVVPTEIAVKDVTQGTFTRSDVSHLRDCYLFRQIVRWVDQETRDDFLLKDWYDEVESEKGQEHADQIRTATRLFDWTVRNIALEPRNQGADYPSPPQFSRGMKFQGPGYRQSDYETVWHGTGDALQRAGVFTQLCRQANLSAAVLATQSTETGELSPWAVGVLVDKDVYLFEPELGTYIPGPDQVGIATLAMARTEATVIRRLNVPGFFDYPISKEDVQQNVALLNCIPVALSPRMKKLQAGLTGDRRTNVFVDAAQREKNWDAARGIAGVRLWDVPLLAEIYRAELLKSAERDPRIAFWYNSRWAMMDAEFDSAKQLARGRWEHLHGHFENDDLENTKGARSYYLNQRPPEFEIDDLRIDVELQKAYGIRRELRAEPEVYDRQVQQVQELMRMGKRTATYWLSLLQYDDQRYENALSWLERRVLDEKQRSFWEPAARYNLARIAEKLDDFDRAIELYKTEGSPQEHGNRIRARLLAKSAE